MKRIFSTLLIVFLILASFMTVMPAPAAFAARQCDEKGQAFFSLKPWYAGLVNSNCDLKNPSDMTEDGSDSSGLAKFIWSIVLNILYDISVVIGYIAVVMIAWGGYLYMFSRGAVERAEKGKKTLIAAIVGLVITILASVIMNTISQILLGA